MHPDGTVHALVRVLMLYNPISGSGRSARLAAELTPMLEEAVARGGDTVQLECAQTRPEPSVEWLDPMLEGVDLLVVVGGDGAMRLAAERAVGAGVAVFHYPAGTENLFAREYGMKAEPGPLVDALGAGRYQASDVMRIDGAIGLLCASIGLDAEVVFDLATHRRGAIKRLSYVRPFLRQLYAWRRHPPRFTVEVDGVSLGEPSPGFVLIGNTHHYAMRLNPALGAETTDGLLDVVHLPTGSVTGLGRWALRCWLGRQFRSPRARRGRGRRIVVRSDRPSRIQIDGDMLGSGTPKDSLVAEVEPGALRLLCPHVRETPDRAS